MTTSPQPLAFVCAMPMELVPLTEKLGLQDTQIGGAPAQRGTVGGRDVVAIVTGMGMDYAREGVERLLDAVPVAHVLVVGITGALESETPIGTLVWPEVVINSQTLAEHKPTPVGDRVPHGKMFTAVGLTTDQSRLAELRNDGVVSLDMETAAIAASCEARGIPWSVYRVISDRANDGSVDEELFALSNMDGTPNHANIKAYFAKHPERLEQMAKMGEDAKLATNAAADAAIAACALL
jgi:nucleoside phosphorylase